MFTHGEDLNPSTPQKLSPEQEALLAKRDAEAKAKLARWMASSKGTEGSDVVARTKPKILPESSSFSGWNFIPAVAVIVLVVVGWLATHGWKFVP